MPLTLQAKLLRALQEREVVPIGGTMPEKVDVRVVACANRDLQGEVAAGRFRADLYYRLSVFPLTTKALAERPGDIAALSAAMVLRHAGGPRRDAVDLDTGSARRARQPRLAGQCPRARERHPARCCCSCGGRTIDPEHLIFDRPAARRVEVEAAGTLSNIVQIHEFAAIREPLLAECGGSRIEAAKRLGISERTLRYRLAKAREQGEEHRLR